MSAKDKQRLGIAVGLVVVVAAAVYFFVFRKPASDVTTEGASVVGTGLRGAPAAPAAPVLPAAAPAPAAPAPSPVAAAAPPGAPAGAAAAQPGGAVSPELPRPDPFVPLHPPPAPRRRPRPLPPLAIQVVGVPAVSAQVLPAVEIAVAQRQRMAGVLYNEHVWAIIETEDKVAVVQPGDRVDDNTVRAISPQALVLASSTGRENELRLQGRVVVAAAAAVGAVGAPAVPVAAPAAAAPAPVAPGFPAVIMRPTFAPEEN